MKRLFRPSLMVALCWLALVAPAVAVITDPQQQFASATEHQTVDATPVRHRT